MSPLCPPHFGLGLARPRSERRLRAGIRRHCVVPAGRAGASGCAKLRRPPLKPRCRPRRPPPLRSPRLTLMKTRSWI
ncbi:ORFL227W [Human betaherpesvirus 5]|nr:ORFL227W [Human betaherpesvirus 5]QHX40592.1 ORFL227W [Human betaherpesvirus 5]